MAVIEAAQVIGLARLPRKAYHPFQLDTYGLGRVLEAAVRSGAERAIFGIGGSATNDGGFGLARALGWQFLDRRGSELDQWWQLTKLARVVPPIGPRTLEMTVATDVRNPLLGSDGCSRVYGPQKGLAREEIAFADRCLHRLAKVLEQQTGRATAELAGAGAAGGLGFGLITFAGAHARSGFDVFAETARLEERIRRADLVITGEGMIDRQTFMGKGVGQVVLLCERLNVRCIAMAGSVDGRGLGHAQGLSARALTELAAVETAKREPAIQLERLAARIAGDNPFC